MSFGRVVVDAGVKNRKGQKLHSISRGEVFHKGGGVQSVRVEVFTNLHEHHTMALFLPKSTVLVKSNGAVWPISSFSGGEVLSESSLATNGDANERNTEKSSCGFV